MALVPYVIEQSSRGERSFDIYSRLLEDRIVMLNEEVNSASASVVVAQLLYLESKDPTKDISLYINSPGGSVTDGFAIFDTMNYIKCDVSTINLRAACQRRTMDRRRGRKRRQRHLYSHVQRRLDRVDQRRWTDSLHSGCRHGRFRQQQL